MNGLHKAIEKMTGRIGHILKESRPSVYLYGSAAMQDFKEGWSDIDILVLTQDTIPEQQAEQLVHLRQTMLAEEPENPYYRSFEGGMLSLDGFLTGTPDRVVYWGTSGERLDTRYHFDSFCRMQLLDSGILLHGAEIRANLSRPSYEDLKTDVRRHYESIRQHARRTGRELYSYGWLLDISRCIYTLRTGKILAKTAAGEWAVKEKLCPCADVLARALEIRKEPLKHLDDGSTLAVAQTLGDSIQKYADVLEKELRKDLGPFLIP